MKNDIPVHAFTRRYSRVSHQITTPIEVLNSFNGSKIGTTGIWDTGATNTVITKSAAKKLGLAPTGIAVVKGVHGTKPVNRYSVKIRMDQGLSFELQVTECDELADDNSCHLLIGMDIITRGDFSITNLLGQTVMSFRVPSLHQVDFVEDINNQGKPNKSKPKLRERLTHNKSTGRNDPCPCGSGKKYKHCHGKEK